jgi:hypothetical protein
LNARATRPLGPRDDESVKRNDTFTNWKHHERIDFDLRNMRRRAKNATDEFDRLHKSVEVHHDAASRAA